MAATSSAHRPVAVSLDVRLLGRFSVTMADRSTGHWPRPSARRLCQFVLVSPERRVDRVTACDTLFPSLRFDGATRALYKAQSMARLVLDQLGPAARSLLCADRSQIWVAADLDLRVDLDDHEHALRQALTAAPGPGRDGALVAALSVRGVPLEDEPEAEWAARARERIEYLRQEVRLELARDRSRGGGCAHPDRGEQAWQACLEADPTCEEAASALVRSHLARGRRPAAFAVYERCRGALSRLGLQTSPAFDRLWADAAGSSSSLEGVSPPVPGQAGLHRAEERRLVTVVCVGLGPVGLDAEDDPEDVRDLVGSGLAQAIGQAEALGGTVASVSGSGVSVLFGAPQAHEDDPERALRLSLRIIAAVSPTSSSDGHGLLWAGGGPPPAGALSVRIGVETGTAVVGQVGAGDRTGLGAVGGVVGVAATLQSAARPASVLVGPATYRAAKGIFEWGPTEHVVVTAGGSPLAGTYLLTPKARPAAEVGRRRLAAKAPLVGRDIEVALLAEAVRATVSGRGGAVIIEGEPGLGKTRLVGECRNYFMGWAGAASGRLPLWLEGRCASYASSSPYGAYQQLLSRFIGVPLEAGEAVVRAALETAMRAVLGTDKEPVALLARMLGLPPGPDEGHVTQMGPSELQHQTSSAMRSVLGGLVARGPTVLAIEDLHWSDPTSLQLTGELAALAAFGPLLLLATRRPEPDPGVSELESQLADDPARPLQLLHLTPIREADERSLARSLLGGNAGDDVVEIVCRGVDGNPLFLEERLTSLLDTGAIERDHRGWRAVRGETSHVPQALERLVRSRVDRLSPAARDAVVAASVLGEEAEHSAIGAVSEQEAGLEHSLRELVSAGLLTLIRDQPEPVYRFRHALIREATYSSLLRSQRRHLHARAAWDLETRSAGRLEEVGAVLGHHFAAAGDVDRAVHYLEFAGDHADQIFANEEAIALYRQALAVIDQASGGADRVQLVTAPDWSVAAARLCEKLADVLLLIDRYSEARSVALAGLARVPPQGNLQAARLHYLLSKVEYQEAHFDIALGANAAALALIGEPGLDDDQAWVDLWIVLQLGEERAGLFRQCTNVERRAIVEAARPLSQARARGIVAAYFFGASAGMRTAQHRHRIDDLIIEDRRRAADATLSPEPTTLKALRPERCQIANLCNLGMALTWHGDLDEAQGVYEQALARAERNGSPGARGVVLVELAVVAFRRGDVEGVRNRLPETTAAAAARSDPYQPLTATALQAWVAWRDDRWAEALAVGADALEHWQPSPNFYPYCIAAWPVAGAHLQLGHTELAIGAARRLLEPAHARLPDELETAVGAAGDAWDHGEREGSAQALADAMELARDLGYA